MKNIIGIIVADDGEYLPLIDKLSKYNLREFDFYGRKAHFFDTDKSIVYTVHCGIGKVNAATASMFLVESKKCNILLNYGFSGGISSVKKGETVIADSFIEHDFDLTALGYKPCEKPSQEYIYKADENLLSKVKELYPDIKSGLAVSGDSFISNNMIKEKLKNDFGALSCDMETAAIASVAHLTDTAFISVREISDDAGDNANDSYKSVANCGNLSPLDCILKLIEVL